MAVNPLTVAEIQEMVATKKAEICKAVFQRGVEPDTRRKLVWPLLLQIHPVQDKVANILQKQVYLNESFQSQKKHWQQKIADNDQKTIERYQN